MTVNGTPSTDTLCPIGDRPGNSSWAIVVPTTASRASPDGKARPAATFAVLAVKYDGVVPITWVSGSETVPATAVPEALTSGTTVATCPRPASPSCWVTVTVRGRVAVPVAVAWAVFGRTVRVFVPRESIEAATCCADPLPTARSRMTAATPMSTPRSVSTDRSLFAVTPRSALSRTSPGVTVRLRSARRPGSAARSRSARLPRSDRRRW